MLQKWREHGAITCAGYIGFPGDTKQSILRGIEIIKRELPLGVLELFMLPTGNWRRPRFHHSWPSGNRQERERPNLLGMQTHIPPGGASLLPFLPSTLSLPLGQRPLPGRLAERSRHRACRKCRSDRRRRRSNPSDGWRRSRRRYRHGNIRRTANCPAN